IHHMRLFKASLENDAWIQKGEITGGINAKDKDVANLTLNPSGDKIYFTRCYKNWKYKTICQIYVSQYHDGAWNEPVKVNGEINHKKYTNTQPSIGIDPKKGHDIMYFSSDRPGGKGGLDLWYSELKNGVFTTPRNCGTRINTPGDEITPFYDIESNALYFSSDGHPGFGAMDIFKAYGQKSKWIKEVENLRMPFNSPADDLYLIYGENPKEGYLTSNRLGGIALKNPTCCDDIYHFEHDEYKIFNYQAQLLSDGEENEERLTKATIDVYIRDTETGDTSLIKTVSVDSRGRFTLKVLRDLNYLLIVESKDHFKKTLKIPRDEKQRLYNEMDTIRLQKITEEAIVLKNIYYDFDDWSLTSKAKLAIDSFLLELLLLNSDIIVEISSHTDAKGSSEYNIRLSQKRAESVVSYLRQKGISRNRMVAKGYGKTKPIAPNKKADGSDNPEGRQLNRRTEFRVIGFEKDIGSRR
ncbi:MAG: OmpA family protein, partial [Vicingaceae bacterium]